MALSELKREDLTPEELKELETMYRKYQTKCIITFFGYLLGSFIGCLIVGIVNVLYVHEPGFQFLGSVATAVLSVASLRKTLEEYSDSLAKEAQKFVKH
jgi:hypothetical protein